MIHKLPELPYPKNALEPHISAETLEYHHGKHHKAYVETLNKLIKGTAFESSTLDDIVKRATGTVFNNAGQHWNHSFYWNCMSPDGGGEPNGTIAEAIDRAFGSFGEFRQKFTDKALTTFGSGWAWLVKNTDGGLAIISTPNAGSPMTGGETALLTCDVWEHAYYIDYRNARAKYIDAFWNVVNWEFVEKNLG